MTINSIASTTSSAATDASGTTAATTRTTGKSALGQQDFLKLLAVQFQQQDPMKPTEDTAFIAQMAQFTSLDQTSSLVQQMTQMRADQQLSTANSYMGRSVTLSTGDDTTTTGNVSAIDMSSGTPQLMVNGQAYPLSSVLYVEPGTTTNPSLNSAANAAA